jgi:thiamine pyrophosphate-dependent acetolactate synthase large subunit-like protein
MFGQHPATELGVVDEATRLDLLLAAWGVRKVEVDKTERQRFKLRRALNRELAVFLSFAVNNQALPEIADGEDEPERDEYDPVPGDYVLER